MKHIEINSLNELHNAAREFITITKGCRKFAFYGAMGAGKTTFIKAICKELGAESIVTSPSFALINEYTLKTGECIYHFDLYRINTLDELFDLGYEEYFYGDSYVFIEWAGKVEELLPETITRVMIEEESPHKHVINIDL